MSLKKIAEMTGVSVSTVSRVLNNRDYNCASEEVKDRIWAAAEKIQYVPNESARNLKKGNKANGGTPARSLAIILERFESLDDDPFFRELYRSVEQEAFSRGCMISGVQVLDARRGNTEALKSRGNLADGYIILGRSSPQTLSHLKAIGKNIVSISRNPTHFEIDEIICDGRSAAERAIEYLISKGYRRIGYIGDCSYEDRYVGYCDTLIRNGLPMDYANIIPSDQTAKGGCAAMKKLLEQKTADAVFCANDATAIGALQGWREYRADKQYARKTAPLPALISIDDIRAAAEVTPSLTTVHVPHEDMGKTAVKVLLDRIEKGHTENIRVEFPSRLVIRESC
ncbi:MAG: LacI family transcriptional regulator [Lachnospiraceae bacterium]|nr:LacI family transcriptional regulator [Lachnospiraceae bacterium]